MDVDTPAALAIVLTAAQVLTVLYLIVHKCRPRKTMKDNIDA